jgi:hypothetical protein
MIKFSSENKNALTPGFVSQALEGITHRFLLVLECETRMYSEGQQPNTKHPIVPPRFAIGGPRATIDPRVAKVEELMPLAKYKLQLPDGWEKVHQYIYVLQPSTDEHGWQYRSEWSNGPLTEKDEQWVRNNAPGLDVRRRLWMATVVSRDLVVQAKRRLAEAISSRVRGVIMEGPLFRQEQGALMKSWQRRHVVLTDDTIEIYTSPKDEGGRRIAELSVVDCEAKMLFGVQCPGRDFAFSIRKSPKNTLVALFDSETREVRRRWVVAIRYQLALLSPEVNFPPFDYGPPTGDEAATRVLMCGELQKQGHMVRNWKHRFFQLMPYEIQYFERETLKGNFMIAGAVLTTDEKSLDFSLRSPTGKILVMRADNPNNKATWVRALARQIAILDEKKDETENDTSASDNQSESAPTLVSSAAAAAAEEEAVKAEKAEEEEEDKEWQMNNQAAARVESNEVVVVTTALENTNITKDEVPTAAVEEPQAESSIPENVAEVTAAVVATEAVQEVANHQKNEAAAENPHYPYADGNRMHQPSEFNEYEQQQQDRAKNEPTVAAPEPVSEADIKVEVGKERAVSEEAAPAPAPVPHNLTVVQEDEEGDEDSARPRSSTEKNARENSTEADASARTSAAKPNLSPKASPRPSSVGVGFAEVCFCLFY